MTDEQIPDEYIDAIKTRWSLVRLAHLNGQAIDAGQARQRLVMRYAAAIRRYVGAIVRDQNHADEISQEVIVRLIRGDFSGADPQRGRFRDLLKTAYGIEFETTLRMKDVDDRRLLISKRPMMLVTISSNSAGCISGKRLCSNKPGIGCSKMKAENRLPGIWL